MSDVGYRQSRLVGASRCTVHHFSTTTRTNASSKARVVSLHLPTSNPISVHSLLIASSIQTRSISLCDWSSMARGSNANGDSTPRNGSQKAAPASSAKTTHKQQSIAGFFQKRSLPPAASVSTPAKRPADDAPAVNGTRKNLDASSAIASSPRTAPGASQQSSVGSGRNKENGE